MSEVVSAIVVTLEKDLDLEEVQPLIDAIRCFRNVIEVKPAAVDRLEMSLAHQRASFELKEKLWQALEAAEIKR